MLCVRMSWFLWDEIHKVFLVLCVSMSWFLWDEMHKVCFACCVCVCLGFCGMRCTRCVFSVVCAFVLCYVG